MISVKNSSNFLTIAASLICVGSIISFVKGNDSVKPLALNLIASSASVAIASKVSESLCESTLQSRKNILTEQHENQLKILKTENKNWNEKITKLSKQVDGKDKSIHDLQNELDAHKTSITAYQNQVANLQREFAAKHKILDEKLKTDDKRCDVILYELKKVFQNDLKYRVQVAFEQQSERVAYHLSNQQFLNIHPALIKYDELIKKNYLEHCKLLSTIALLDGDSNQIISSICEIYEVISNDVSNSKVRYRNILNLDERTALQGAMEELVERRDTKKFVPMPKVKVALDNYENSQKDELNKIATTASEKFNEIEDLKSQVSALIDEIDSRNLKIAELQQVVVELNQPIQWRYAISAQGLAGNRIIQFFANKRIILDRSHYLGDLFKTEIYFHVDRNKSGTVLAKDLNEFSEYLGQMCECLEPIRFEWDADNHLMLATAVFSRKEKKQPIEKLESDINKIWVSADKFESFVKKFERVRITAGSTGGKSPTAKNLALAIMNSRKGKGKIKLYDPQHGSKKDYWNMPKFGTSHEDNLTGMRELCELIDTRRGKTNNEFILYIFDEVDNTVSNLGKASNEFKNYLKIAIKEGSHADIGAIFIGQSADANEVPGMTHSNWNNAVQIHIGSNAGTCLDKLTTITSEEKTRLLEQYRKIQEYCDTKNEQLGLDIFTDATAYRFALVVPLTGLPKFIQLPDFDTYDYNIVMGVKVSTNTQNSAFANNSITDESHISTDKHNLKIECPHCGSIKFKKHSKVADLTKYRYSCNNPECKKVFIADKIN